LTLNSQVRYVFRFIIVIKNNHKAKIYVYLKLYVFLMKVKSEDKKQEAIDASRWNERNKFLKDLCFK